jgi:membrane-bound ClpP family serine protease
MSEAYTTGNGVWNGWHWRLVGSTVAIIAVLQLVMKYAMHYPLVQSLPLAVLIVVYIVVPRLKQRRLANAVAGVVASFIIGAILELTLENYFNLAVHQGVVWQLVLTNLVFPLLLGLVMAFAYVKLNAWSERKRMETEAKRRATATTVSTEVPKKRVHRTNRKKR